MEKCRPALVVVHQTKIAATAVEEKPNDNLSVPYGLIRTVRHYLEFVGILRYIRGLETKVRAYRCYSCRKTYHEGDWSRNCPFFGNIGEEIDASDHRCSHCDRIFPWDMWGRDCPFCRSTRWKV